MELYKLVTEDYKSGFITTKKYKLIYKIGTIVTAPPGTLGIMLFDTLDNAKAFMKYCVFRGKILVVESLGGITKPRTISRFTLGDMLSLYYKNGEIYNTRIPPKGTVCCQSVKVIKENRIIEGLI